VTGAGVTLIAPDLQPRYVAPSDGSALRRVAGQQPRAFPGESWPSCCTDE
jgi:hypothetical protein